MEYSLSPISSSSALQAAMTAISSHLRSNFNIMPSTVHLTDKGMEDGEVDGGGEVGSEVRDTIEEDETHSLEYDCAEDEDED